MPTTGGNDGAPRDFDLVVDRGAALPEVDDHGKSRTVRLLLELQNAPPPLEGASSARRSARRPAETGGLELLPADGDNEAAASRVDWRSGLPGRNGEAGVAASWLRDGTGTNRPARAGGDEDAEAIKALLPAKLLALLREYREWIVIGGVLFLALAGLGASAVSQRGR